MGALSFIEINVVLYYHAVKLTQKMMTFYVIFAGFKSFLLIIFTIILGHQNTDPGH